MFKVCIHCGEMVDIEKDIHCSKCGRLYNAPLGKEEMSLAIGSKLQGIVLLVLVLSAMNLIVGTVISFMVMYIPKTSIIYSRLPYTVFVWLMTLVPILNLVYLGLLKVAKCMYNTVKHAPKNLSLCQYSYRMCIWSELSWLLIVVVGMLITIYNYK